MLTGITFLLVLLSFTNLFAADWPQYRGADRDGISKESGLLKTWPTEGPRVLWRANVGDGYSGVSISGRRLFTMEARGNDEYVLCLVAATGSEIWRSRIDTKLISDQGDGPRSTPTVDGNLVFAISGQGVLYALDVSNGAKVWNQDLKKNFGVRLPGWGFSSSPLVEGDLLIVPAGGGKGNAVLAFNKKNGALAWKSQTDEPGYSSPIAITVNGIRQLIIFSGTNLFSLSPKDGKLFWQFPWATGANVNAAVPIFIPNDKIFISTSYDHGAALLRVKADRENAAVEQIWISKSMMNHFNTSVLHNGYIYGFDNAILKCIDTGTAKDQWQKSGFGKGSLILAEGHLLVLGERGQLALIEATAAAYKERAKSQVLTGKCWTMPAISGGKLYLRNQKEIVCLDLKAKA